MLRLTCAMVWCCTANLPQHKGLSRGGSRAGKLVLVLTTMMYWLQGSTNHVARRMLTVWSYAASFSQNPKVTEDRAFNGFGTNFADSPEPIYGTQVSRRAQSQHCVRNC